MGIGGAFAALAFPVIKESPTPDFADHLLAVLVEKAGELNHLGRLDVAQNDHPRKPAKVPVEATEYFITNGTVVI